MLLNCREALNVTGQSLKEQNYLAIVEYYYLFFSIYILYIVNLYSRFCEKWLAQQVKF
jgi:hypothetical protein